MITPEEVRNIALSFPEAVEVKHWDKPSFRVRNKIFAVIQPDRISLVIKTAPDDRAVYTMMDPDIYQMPAAFSNLNYMVVRMDRVEPAELHGLLIKAWRSVSPKRLITAFNPDSR
ncbi:hypothetical protein SD71_12320 [Cohnella kolymensis]|uniref:MmcQ/YjbR family DNA-binding protein n=1 Tax=Cohnella kolymensis TaxID=1590652 RepID=A0ABR5A3V1_9BACL|nr:MmcQ/YjbR family DNA-binding protein [Cohnella kolymensis]KIL35675.1 hypothetical protein SD71_12320 [Cohnella kolymensis]